MILDKSMKCMFRVIFLSGFLVSGPAMVYADEGIGNFSANVGYFSEYRFRGLDQSGKRLRFKEVLTGLMIQDFTLVPGLLM